MMFIIFSKNIVRTLCGAVLLFAMAGCAQKAELAAVMSVEKVALNGYDAVAYYSSAKAVKAGGSYSFAYEGINWHFETAENLEIFKEAPQNYIPAFGGFCAYALSEGSLRNSEGTHWQIHNATLYLFKDKEAKEEWFREIDIRLEAGQKQWELMNAPLKESAAQD
jgi:YHS domain-containing protein